MFDSTSNRRFLFVFVLVAASCYAMNYVEYHPTLHSQLLTSNTLVVFVLTGLFIRAIVWAFNGINVLKGVVILVLGIIVDHYGNALFRGNIVFFTVCGLGFIALSLLIVANRVDVPSRSFSFTHYRNAARRPSTNP